METKKCKKCGIEKPITDFYVLGSNRDGHFSSCKECVKARVHRNYLKNIENSDYIEKERLRGRDKYRKLYAGRLDKTRSHKENSSTRDFLKRRGIEMDGMEVHHWNYNLKNCVFLLSPREHKLVHRNMVFDKDSNMFSYKGELLKTKDMHQKVIEELIGREVEAYSFS